MKNSFINFFCPKLDIVLVILMFAFCSEGQREFCKMSSETECVIECGNKDSNSSNDLVGVNDFWQVQAKRFGSCTLIVKETDSTRKTKEIFEKISSLEKPKLENLKLVNDMIDLNEMEPEILKNLRRLTLKNTTTVSLRLEVFSRLPKLRKLQIKKHNHIKWVERYFLKNLTLNYLQIHGILLNEEKSDVFFRNLTGGCQIPSIRKIDWSHNNFGYFSQHLLSGFVNLDTLILTNSCIFNFHVDTFINLTVNTAYFNQNRLQKLPEKTFSHLIKNAALVSFEDNNLTCNCEMEWLQSFVKRQENFLQYFRTLTCAWPNGAHFLEVDMCSQKNPPRPQLTPSTVRCTSKQNSQLMNDYKSWTNTTHSFQTFNHVFKQFTITNDDPESIEIYLSANIDLENAFIWYGSFPNTPPTFSCFKILQPRLSLNVTPDLNYFICLVTVVKYFRIDIFDCLPFKAKPLYENQPWLSKKSISKAIISVSFVFVFGLAMGALILYLSVRKNPTLLRGSKRVIEVKRHDKAEILIMPRDYEESIQNENASLALMGPHRPLEPSRSSLSCDTISTVSYISVIQPTQFEIFTYRLNRLRELFHRNNNIPSPVASFPRQITTPNSQKLPPNVDLLFEYERYTITMAGRSQLKKFPS